MIGLVIGTHGIFSEELIKSAEMIFGVKKNVGYVTFKPGEGTEELICKYQQEVSALNCTEGILFMVDIFGGSPFNAASMLALKNNNMEIVTGVNLPMLLEVFGSIDFSTLSELVIIAENAGKESIKQLVKQTNTNSGEDDL